MALAPPTDLDAVDALLGALDSQRLIGLLSDRDPSLDETGAYAIAAGVHARRLARGERAVGRKIGFTNRTIWPEYGVHAPLWGHVYASTVHYARQGTARVPIGHLLQPRIEPEIQLHFARTPPVTDDERVLLDSIDWIALGFEIIQCPYADWKFRPADAIAAFGLHGALAVGTPVAVRDVADAVAALRRFTVTLTSDAGETLHGLGANVLDGPLPAFAHLVRLLHDQGSSPIEAGEIVTTGTLTTPRPISPGQTWTVSVDGIGLPALALNSR